MTAREAYEEDCRRQPLYHDGAKRHTWDRLSDAIRWSWERNPTPREWSPVAERPRNVERAEALHAALAEDPERWDGLA